MTGNDAVQCICGGAEVNRLFLQHRFSVNLTSGLPCMDVPTRQWLLNHQPPCLDVHMPHCICLYCPCKQPLPGTCPAWPCLDLHVQFSKSQGFSLAPAQAADPSKAEAISWKPYGYTVPLMSRAAIGAATPELRRVPSDDHFDSPIFKQGQQQMGKRSRPLVAPVRRPRDAPKGQALARHAC